ncbi:HsdR family type I site-specific deoxyribonuclease [Parapedobacter defluvii]|uniref:type I restriction endonuclease subunit R n=1 Tax=Parapedobacter defluvii TaxID=2045106 RepID=UPI00333E99FF
MGFNEDNISQIPAVKLLVSLGYTYLSKDECIELRGGRESNVILEPILREQLKAVNRIRVNNRMYAFSDTNIEQALVTIKDVPLVDGLVATSSKVYNLLLFGKALVQSIDGDTKSHTIQYIDWEHIGTIRDTNVYHITEEFPVTRMGRSDSYRPDIVLFVNGIPLCIIECKSPSIKDPISQAISQHIRNQQENGIPQLYVYSQLLLSLSLTSAKYATTNTKEEFWASWREKDEQYIQHIAELVNEPLESEVLDKIFAKRYPSERKAYDEKYSLDINPTEQDRYIYGLLSKERLLDIIHDFILFEGGVVKKVARYQQYFAIHKVMQRIKPIKGGRRKGGVVWHTQGSGKSLTMAMLAKKIKQEIKNPKIILVTDRIDLDNQITRTLKRVEVEVANAYTGKELIYLLKGNGDQVITTIINKFQAAAYALSAALEGDPDVFVLIDEGHRTQYGTFNVKMEKVLPTACFVVFTGTPLMKKQKSTAKKFGGIIDSYTILEAVEDGAIVPILYEGRHAIQDVNQSAIDKGFARIAREETEEYKAELKRKTNRAGLIYKTEQNINEIAFDISEHFSNNWGRDKTGTHSGFRGMVVVEDKLTAIKYKRAFDLIGQVKTEVVMSPPDTRENNEDVHSSEATEVVKYYEKLKSIYGTEIDSTIISIYEHGNDIELLIVIDKLLTGFDVPQTVVMYLCRKLREHTLLQAIARVNRVYPGKDYGFIIDYAGIVLELKEAMETYSDAENTFDQEDLEGAFSDVQVEINKLPVAYAQLQAIFKQVKNKLDLNAHVELLSDIAIREDFYNKFAVFARILKIALASIDFERSTPYGLKIDYQEALSKYAKIRVMAMQLYEDQVNFKQYEKQLQKLLDQHVITDEIIRVVAPVDIVDKEAFEAELEKLAGPRAKAEKIAVATAKHISIHMDQDPALYKRLSELIRETIAEMRARRLSELEALRRLQAIQAEALGEVADDIPDALKRHRHLAPYYRLVKNPKYSANGNEVNVVLKFDELIKQHRVIDMFKKRDVIGKIEIEFGDYLMDELDFTLTQADELTKEMLKAAIANEK